jgi:hypothetical protein
MQIEGARPFKALALERLPLVFDGGGESHRHVCELGQMPGSIARRKFAFSGRSQTCHWRQSPGKQPLRAVQPGALSGESVPPIGFR